MKHYKWHLDRLTAFLVVVVNIVLAVYLSMRALTDDYFLLTQTGLNLSSSMLYGITVIVIGLTIYWNLKFFQRNHTARWVIGLVETILMASVLRNIFVGHMYFGFGLSTYIGNGLMFVLLSFLIYHTLFSKQIRVYFLEETKN